jgi:hypothetical protein
MICFDLAVLKTLPSQNTLIPSNFSIIHLDSKKRYVRLLPSTEIYLATVDLGYVRFVLFCLIFLWDI